MRNRPATLVFACVISFFFGRQWTLLTLQDSVECVQDQTINDAPILRATQAAADTTSKATIAITKATAPIQTQSVNPFRKSQTPEPTEQKTDRKEIEAISEEALLKQKEEEYGEALKESLKIFPNVSTAANCQKTFAGLTNQIFKFIGNILLASSEGFGQIVELSHPWKDLFGTNEDVQHLRIWDVVRWNSYYPTLPRFVAYDRKLHPHLNYIKKRIETLENTTYRLEYTKYKKGQAWDIWENYTFMQPKPLVPKANSGLNTYRKITKTIEFDGSAWPQWYKFKHVYEAIMGGALRPHPFLFALIEQERTKLRNGGKVMVFHARLEPDMEWAAEICQGARVWNVTEIVDSIYRQFPVPPVNTVLIQFNRDLMEKKTSLDKNHQKAKNQEYFDRMNRYNLQGVNKLLKEGMWGGKVKCAEAGSRLVEEKGGPFYNRYKNIVGGILNMFLGIESDIFIGTEVSSYSTHVINSRLYQGGRESYFYRPEGLVPAIKNNKPHRFVC